MEYVKFEKVSLKRHSFLNEQWLQARIAEDPALLGLGDDVVLKERERPQPSSGRLDILLQDDNDVRYEVEIQLGVVDESHIIRTIEYWDIERKRYPHYEHVAVIVAEDITSRFLNVIGLFNGMIPLIALQVNAFQHEGKVGLQFVKVMDEMPLGQIDEDEEVEVTDRAYWENKASPKTVAMADEFIKLAQEQCDQSLELKYNKQYIGLAKEGRAGNFFILKPKKNFLRFSPKLEESSETDNALKDGSLDFRYKSRSGRYTVFLNPDDIEKNKSLLENLIKEAYKQMGGA